MRKMRALSKNRLEFFNFSKINKSIIQVFIDVDKLYAGKFDASLLKNIQVSCCCYCYCFDVVVIVIVLISNSIFQAAKHFILVLTPNSLDRLLNDVNCDDWIHKEVWDYLNDSRLRIDVYRLVDAFESIWNTFELISLHCSASLFTSLVMFHLVIKVFRRIRKLMRRLIVWSTNNINYCSSVARSNTTRTWFPSSISTLSSPTERTISRRFEYFHFAPTISRKKLLSQNLHYTSKSVEEVAEIQNFKFLRTSATSQSTTASDGCTTTRKPAWTKSNDSSRANSVECLPSIRYSSLPYSSVRSKTEILTRKSDDIRHYEARKLKISEKMVVFCRLRRRHRRGKCPHDGVRLWGRRARAVESSPLIEDNWTPHRHPIVSDYLYSLCSSLPCLDNIVIAGV